MTSVQPRALSPRAFGLGALALLLLAWRFWFVCDDAYISYRYSRHLVEGHGLVFNLGESPPVEGYSNLLWVLWVAPFEALGVAPGLAANVTSVLCALLLLALVLRFAARRLGLHGRAQGAVALALGSCPAFALWATGGLETMAFALACFLAFERLALEPERPRWVQAGAAALAAALLRADGALFAGTFLLLGAAEGLPSRSRAHLRALLGALAILAAGVALHLAWRWSYHHDFLPNTARVKAGFSALRLERGLKYVGTVLLAVPAAAVVCLASLLARDSSRWLRVRCALAVLVVASYSVHVGGDFMPFGRYLVPAIPFLALLGAAALAAWWPDPARPAPGLTLSALVVALQLAAAADLSPFPRSWRDALRFRWNDNDTVSEVVQWKRMKERVRSWSLTGRALARISRPGDSIILGAVGAIGYHSDLFVHDLYGLVSPEVVRSAPALVRASPGHDRRVPPDFFLEYQPTYLNAWIERVGAPDGEGISRQASELLALGKVKLEHHSLAGIADTSDVFELRCLRLSARAEEWVPLTGGERSGAPRSDDSRRVRFQEDGLAVWVDYELPPEAWSPGDAPGHWIATRPDGLSFMKVAEELALGSESTRLRYQQEIDDPNDFAKLSPGSFATMGERIHLLLEAGEALPEHLLFSVRKSRTLGARPALGDWTGDGFQLWTGEAITFRVAIGAARTLRFHWCLEGLASGTDGPSRARVRVQVDEESVFEQELESAGKGTGAWCAVDLPDRGGSEVALRFELDGDLASAAVLAPLVGPRSAALARRSRGEDASRPDLILFMADTFRADLLDYEGGDPSWTPHLNDLARRSLRFRAARSPSTWTLPAQASMLTGLYPEQHGATSLGHAVASSLATLPEVLAAAGYRTGAVTDSAFVSRNYGFDQGFAWFHENRAWNLRQTLKAAREFLLADDGRPVFLFVHTFRMHMPYRVGPDEDRTALAELVAELRARCAEYGGDGSVSRGEAARRLDGLYRRAAGGLDELFGAWWREVEGRPDAPPTYLVFTSDHGEAFSEHGEMGHGGTPWEEKTRIPLFVHGPGVTPGDVAHAASLVDLPATFCALAGLATDPAWQGTDLLALDRPRTAYSFIRIGERSMVALVDGTHKVYGAADPERLHAGEITAATDLASDPRELRNLASSEAWPAELARSRAADVGRLVQALASAARVDISEEDRRFLDDIGYGGD